MKKERLDAVVSFFLPSLPIRLILSVLMQNRSNFTPPPPPPFLCAHMKRGSGGMKNDVRRPRFLAVVVTAVLTMAMTWRANGDDEVAALRNTLQSLCSLNTVGKFGSNCHKITDWRSVTLDNAEDLELVYFSGNSNSLSALFDDICSFGAF